MANDLAYRMTVSDVIRIRRIRPTSVDQLIHGRRLDDVGRAVVRHQLGAARIS